MQKATNLINLILTIDVFFVFASFFWFLIAVFGKYNNFPLGLDLWQSLWMPVFQPAIGLLMAGAILSGIISQFNKKFNQG